MKKLKHLLSALAVPLLFTGCVIAIGNESAQQYKQRGAAQLLNADMAFARAAREKGVAQAFKDYAAHDAVSFPMEKSPVHGRDAIFEAMKEFPAGQLLWTPTAADVSRGEDLGYTWGTWEFITKDSDGKPTSHHGKYVTVWKRQTDGAWKYVADIGNTGPAPQ